MPSPTDTKREINLPVSQGDDSPPKYQGEAGSSTQAVSKAFIVALEHCKAGKVNSRGKLLAGPLIEKINDAIEIPLVNTYQETKVLLANRVFERFKGTISGDLTVSIVINVGDTEATIVDEESWTAAKVLLLKDEAKIRYLFADKQEGLKHAPKAKSSRQRRCVVQ